MVADSVIPSALRKQSVNVGANVEAFQHRVDLDGLAEGGGPYGADKVPCDVQSVNVQSVNAESDSNREGSSPPSIPTPTLIIRNARRLSPVSR